MFPDRRHIVWCSTETLTTNHKKEESTGEDYIPENRTDLSVLTEREPEMNENRLTIHVNYHLDILLEKALRKALRAIRSRMQKKREGGEPER